MVLVGRYLKLELVLRHRCKVEHRFPAKKAMSMTVIAKMNMSRTEFADGSKLNMTCVFDVDLAKPQNEDVRFTKATPWGQAETTVGPDVLLPDWPQSHGQVYVMFTEASKPPLFSECMFAVLATCASLIDTGFQKQVELSSQRYAADSPVPVQKRCGPFSLKMGVDNPAASIQFVPQKTYWIAVMDATGSQTVDVLGMARVEGKC